MILLKTKVNLDGYKTDIFRNTSTYLQTDPPKKTYSLPEAIETHLGSIQSLAPSSTLQINVSDEVKDFWEPPYTEPGVPPLLTMPGVQSANDLVSTIAFFVLF